MNVLSPSQKAIVTSRAAFTNKKCSVMQLKFLVNDLLTPRGTFSQGTQQMMEEKHTRCSSACSPSCCPDKRRAVFRHQGGPRIIGHMLRFLFYIFLLPFHSIDSGGRRCQLLLGAPPLPKPAQLRASAPAPAERLTRSAPRCLLPPRRQPPRRLPRQRSHDQPRPPQPPPHPPPRRFLS